MKTKSPDTGKRTTTELNLSPDAVFGVLSDATRRRALRYLTSRIGAISVEELSSFLAADGLESTRQDLRVALHHVHLPKLADAGLVHYDAKENVVELGVESYRITPYLDLSSPSRSS